MSERKRCKIKDLGKVVTGHTPPTKERRYYGDKYIFIKPTDIDENSRYVSAVEEKLSDEGYERFRSAIIPPLSPCMVTIGSLGKKMCITSDWCFTNQAINALIVNSEHNNMFIYYLFRTLLPAVKFLSNGTASGRENVSKSSFEQIEVLVPEKIVQGKVSAVLSTYDDLIENNNRRIAILEEMAQRLYREWFVHFRFPGHENVEMVDSELGMIPEKWKSGCLEDIAQNHRKSIKKADRGNYKYYLPIDCLPRKSLLLRDVRPISEAESSLTEFCEGDIIMGAMRVYFHKVISAPFSGLTRSTCFVIRPLIDTYSSYLLMTLYQNESIEYANTISVGATMPYVIWETFSKMKVIIPSLDIAKKYNDVVHPIIKEIKRVYFQNANLCKTRDHLLPRLISGDIDVSKIEI